MIRSQVSSWGLGESLWGVSGSGLALGSVLLLRLLGGLGMRLMGISRCLHW